MKGQPDAGESVSELLAGWRGAQRDSIAARNAAEVARRAMKAAVEADEAATEAQEAAHLAVMAADKATEAARKAKRAAIQVLEDGRLLLASAQGDVARAEIEVRDADAAEKRAHRRFNEASRAD
jgi:hypothetical protein